MRRRARLYRSFTTKGRLSEHQKVIVNERKLRMPSYGIQSFSMCGRMQESGLAGIIPSHASQPSWPSILCFHIPSCHGAHRQEWLQPEGWHSSPSECPRGSHWSAGLPMTVTSLFTDMAGTSSLLNRIGFPFQLQLRE